MSPRVVTAREGTTPLALPLSDWPAEGILEGGMIAATLVVRCPRCGAMEVDSAPAGEADLDRLTCRRCGCSEACDTEETEERWSERVPPEVAPSEEQWTLLPEVRFAELWARLGARGSHRETLRRIRMAYGEGHRAYHTARHVSECLRLLDDPEVRRRSGGRVEVEAALWWHDLVYDPRSTDNEERSAEDAIATLAGIGVSEVVVDRVAAYVLATKTHASDDPGGALVIDVDLSILGESPATFARFERDIRREYAWVPPAAYAAGRATVLRRFLEREHIYATPLFRDRYEARARANIEGALRALAG
ncbi:MAG: hypothetical protein JST00_20235 [Deltaproteobacteria bacterium]|nr:hypothetical protein [Deltaproteobacteria bacterium]